MTLQERINKLITESGKKPVQLATYVKISRSAVSDWMHGKTKSISANNAFLVGEFFNVSPRWIASGEGPMEVTVVTKEIKRTWNIGTERQGNVSENSNHYKTPFFQAIESLSLYYCEWDELSHFLSTNENKMEFKKMIVEKIECSEKSFIVVISHNLFQPYVTKGEFCLIDPDEETLNNKVLVKINETFLIKEHIKRDQDYLRSLNGESPLQKLSDELNHEIIGVIKGIWKPMRKG